MRPRALLLRGHVHAPLTPHPTATCAFAHTHRPADATYAVYTRACCAADRGRTVATG